MHSADKDGGNLPKPSTIRQGNRTCYLNNLADCLQMISP